MELYNIIVGILSSREYHDEENQEDSNKSHWLISLIGQINSGYLELDVKLDMGANEEIHSTYACVQFQCK
jgi:hypothetical protein